MPTRVTFIHSGDLHLGAPFRGLSGLSEKWSRRLADAIPQAFDTIIDACIESQVDFLLLAGDVFDTAKPGYGHYRRFIDGLRRLEAQGIAVYVVCGNHDPISNWDEIAPQLPANTELLASDRPRYLVHYRNGEPLAVIAGRGFPLYFGDESIIHGMTRSNALKATSQELNGRSVPFVIGMTHTGLWLARDKAPVSKAEIMASGMDYWALGHIHKMYLMPQDAPELAFCGIPQGRDIHEQGDRFCLKVTLEEDRPNRVDLIPTSSVAWRILDVDVSDCGNLGEVSKACIGAMYAANREMLCEEMVARLRLTGPSGAGSVDSAAQVARSGMLAQLRNPAALEELRWELNEGCPSFFCDGISLEASCEPENVGESGPFAKLVMQEIGAMGQNPTRMSEELMEDFSRLGVMVPDGLLKGLDACMAKAQDTCIELLGGAGL